MICIYLYRDTLRLNSINCVCVCKGLTEIWYFSVGLNDEYLESERDVS